MDRNKMILRQIAKYSVFTLAVILLFVIQTTPGFLEFFGLKPNFILPFCLVLTFFDYESPVLIVYIIAGFLNELAMSRIIGFHAILIICFAVAGNIISTYYFNPNTRNTTIYTFVSMFVLLCIDFFFVYVLGGFTGLMPNFISKVMVMSLISAPLCVPYYYFITCISNRFIRYDAR